MTEKRQHRVQLTDDGIHEIKEALYDYTIKLCENGADREKIDHVWRLAGRFRNWGEGRPSASGVRRTRHNDWRERHIETVKQRKRFDAELENLKKGY